MKRNARTKSFEPEYIMQLLRPDRPVRYANLSGVGVSLIACSLLPQAGGRLKTVIEDSVFESFSLHGCAMNNVVLRNVVVNGLDTGESLFLRRLGLDRVVLKGRVGQLQTYRTSQDPDIEPAELFALDERLRRFYGSVDYALDIRDVDAYGLVLAGVPGRLVLRDPSRTALVSRRRLESLGCNASNVRQRLKIRHFSYDLEVFLDDPDGWDDIVLVGPSHGPHVKMGRIELIQLAEAGVTDEAAERGRGGRVDGVGETPAGCDPNLVGAGGLALAGGARASRRVAPSVRPERTLGEVASPEAGLTGAADRRGGGGRPARRRRTRTK